jgi:hypothetical protein
MVLRVDSSGVYDKIPIKDYTTSGPWGLVEGLWVNMITNADQGVLLTWEANPDGHSNRSEPVRASGARYRSRREHRASTALPTDGVGSRVEFGMAVTTGASLSLVTPPAVPGQSEAFVPVLQAQDGSFVGTVGTGPYPTYTTQDNMIAFDATGSTRWMVPGDYQPKIALADAGIIATDDSGAAITFDQNGNATGQMASLPTQSWRGNMYQQGSVERVLALSISIAKSLWAQAGANPSGNSTAARPWYFKLVWQNDCTASPAPCGFTLYPENPLDQTTLAIDATSQAATIKTAALDAFKKAFNNYPVNASEGRAGTGDHRANVRDGYKFDGTKEYCGATKDWTDVYDSDVYYRKHMEMAQFALPVILITAQDVQNALGRVDLMKAIGTGIGNTAAHELGHQFFRSASGMEDNSTNTYNGAPGCDPRTAGGYFYGSGSVSWEAVTADAWMRMLGVGWHK